MIIPLPLKAVLGKCRHMKHNTSYSLLIPAGGLGLRMKPVRPDIPKEMLPVGIKPAIQYAVAEGFAAGIRDIVIVINSQKDIIRRYFEDFSFRKQLFPAAAEEVNAILRSCRLSFLYQREPLGESDAIGLAANVAHGKVPAIFYPDNIYLPAPGALSSLITIASRHGTNVIALCEVREGCAGTGNSGRVDIVPLGGNLFRIEKFHTKAPGLFVPRYPKELRATGIAVYGPYLFSYIERAKKHLREGEFTDEPVRELLLREKGILGLRLSGNVFDIGNPDGYQRCQSFIDSRDAGKPISAQGYFG